MNAKLAFILIPWTQCPIRIPRVQLALLRYVTDYFYTIKAQVVLRTILSSCIPHTRSLGVFSRHRLSQWYRHECWWPGCLCWGRWTTCRCHGASCVKSRWWSDWYRRDNEINILPKSVGTSNIDAREWLAWSLWDLDRYPPAKSNWRNGWYSSWITKSTYVLNFPRPSLYNPCRRGFFFSSARLG